MSPLLSRGFPFLFAALPLIRAAARYPGEWTGEDLTLVLIALLTVSAAIYWGLRILRVRDPLLRSLCVMGVVVWFYAYPRALAPVERRVGASGAAVATIAAVLATITGIWWLHQRPPLGQRVSTFLSLVGALLVAWFGAGVVKEQISAAVAIRRSALIGELERPIPRKPSGLPVGYRPDIYLIILDEYASNSVLKEFFGFENGEFTDSLRSLGFTVPKLVRSNYAHTTLSIPSILNFAHLEPLSRELGRDAQGRTLPNYLVEHNRAVPFLKREGYQVIFIPSLWWPSTEHMRQADRELRIWDHQDFGRAAASTELRRAWVGITALSLLQHGHPQDADYVKRTFRALEDLSTQPGPKFVLAHVISPHPPFVLTPTCEFRRTRLQGAWEPETKDGYVDQVRCVNHLVLQLVSALLSRSTIAPVILLQADHGTKTSFGSLARGSAVRPDQARERLGAFGAYYLPQGGGQTFGDSLTVVNLLRNVLSYYLGADLPLAPDVSYFSLDRRLYDFVRIDDRWWESHRVESATAGR